MNLMITMLLGGLWHGASISFILWGALHGIALAAHKFIMGHFSSFKALGCEMKPWRRVLGVLITFHVVLFRMDLVPGYLDEGRGRDASPDLYEFSSGGVHAIRLRI